MTFYDYKVIAAPRRLKRVKGVRTTPELMAHTLSDAINEQARQGWEYVRAESLAAEAEGGWFRRGAASDETVLIFRRPRENLGPRLTAVTGGAADAETRESAMEPRSVPVERPVTERLTGGFLRREPAARIEPRLGEIDDSTPTPLRPPPRIGPADKL